MTLFEEFQWRGLVYDATSETADAVKQPLVVYSGFDPTAKSLHVGSLVPLLQLVRCQKFGHTPIVLAGGGTGMIGDPSGKSSERNLQTPEQIDENMRGMEIQLRKFLQFEGVPNRAIFVNNADWLNKVSMVEFLREIGKNFSVNVMMQKESVKRRLESEDGISFTEFCYSLMQAYDYLELFDRHKCTLQIGGSDQWGNITAGTDLIRRKRGAKAHAMVFPLLTTSSGQKFGKTEAGTVWLDAELTSPYQFYQCWYNTDDRDVERYLKTFTFLSQERISELCNLLETAPEKREAQTELAREVTKLVHGEEGVKSAEKMQKLFFGGSSGLITGREIESLVPESEQRGLGANEFNPNQGITVLQLFTYSGICSSSQEAKRSFSSGSAYICSGLTGWTFQRIEDPNRMVTGNDLIDERYVFARAGKKNYYVIDTKKKSG